MNRRFRVACFVVAGAVAVTLVMVTLRKTDPALLETSANAQEKGRPAERSIRRLVEVGPERVCNTQVGFIKAELWGRRTTYSNARVEYSVRFSIAKYVAVLNAEAVADFITFAKQVEEKRKDLQAQPPAKEVSIRWVGRDVEGKEFELFCSASDGVWGWDDAELPGLVDVFEQTLKDIEGIKSNKARVPW